MVKREAPDTETPQTDGRAIAELKAQNKRLITMLDTQNTRMLALLEQLVQNGATANTPAAPPAAPVVANTTTPAAPPAAPPAAASKAAGEARLYRTITPGHTFGQESMAHVTRGRVKAILDEGLRLMATAKGADPGTSWASLSGVRAALSTVSAAQSVMLDMARLIYCTPENQTWYAMDKFGAVLTYTARGWTFGTYKGMASQLSQTILSQLAANRPEDWAKYSLILNCMQNAKYPEVGAVISRPTLDLCRLPSQASVRINQTQQGAVIEVLSGA